MPDDLELDEITARLVSELAANITPVLTQNLNSAIHADDFINAIDRTNMISKDLQNQIEKSIRSGIEDNRAARTMIMQSMRSVFDEVAALRKNLDRVPEAVETALKKNVPEEKDKDKNSEVLQELARLSELIKELIEGLRNFSEVYARDRDKASQNSEPVNLASNEENASRLDKLLNNSLPGLEGLIKAHETAQSRELEEFSKEISTLHKENDKTIIFKLKEIFDSELEQKSKDFASQIKGDLASLEAKNSFLLKVIAGLSGACVILSLVKIFI